ncbi:MAG: sulfatase-like hydrolase/transferase [Lentisphaerales bacterium]|nr:sulfatase-like hydrolase/transferase [Lentisphaerales bacterium]
MKNLAIFLLFNLTYNLSASDKPNILFIAVDDLKPLLGTYGYSEVISPNIDKLAEQGTTFTKSYCQWPVCGGSRASLMTGLYPESTGVMDLKTRMRDVNPDLITIPQHFKKNGYTTAGVGKIFDPRCVDNKNDLDKPSWSIPYTKYKLSKLKDKDKKRFADFADCDDNEMADGAIAEEGLKLMKKVAAKNKPFFLLIRQ